MRIGHGYDVHRLVKDRPLILGGTVIPYERGLQGHSDADALCHAVMDALLGAAGLGDLGQHFPDSEPSYEGARSLTLLACVAEKLRVRDLAVGNVDATVVAQAPKLEAYREDMRRNIAGALGVPAERVNIKATTEEGLGFTGRGEGIAAHAVALLEDGVNTGTA